MKARLQLQVVELQGDNRAAWLRRLRRRLEWVKRQRGRPERGQRLVH